MTVVGDYIQTAHGELDYIIGPSGEQRPLGLIEDRAEDRQGLKLFSTRYKVLSENEIKKRLSSSERKSARELFGPKWIKDQDGIGACFPAGTLIRMADNSVKPIESVSCLDKVVTAEGNVSTVTQTMVREHSGDVVRVQLWGHRHLVCTPEHPILTKRGYIEAENLRKDDWVALPKYAPEVNETVIPEEHVAEPFRVGRGKRYTRKETLAYKIPGKTAVKLVRKALPAAITLDRDFGRIIGLFLAEGNTDPGKVCFTFGAHEKDTLAEECYQLLVNRLGLEPLKVVRGSRCQVKFYGKNWVEFFTAMCASGSNAKRLHPELAAGPREFLEGVLWAWTDGDGLGDPKRNGGQTVSRQLANNMHAIATALGYRPTIEALRGRVQPHEKAKTRQDSYVVAWTDKDNAAKNWRSEQDDKFMWRKVCGHIFEPYQGYVFNLEVEGDHSYVAEGIGVHNCQGYASTSCIERCRFISGQEHVELSGDFAYALVNGNQDRGSALSAGFRAAAKTGYAPQNTPGMPRWKFRQRDFPRVAWELAARFKGLEGYVVRSEAELASALAMGFFAVVAVHAMRGYGSVGRGGVSQGSNGRGNHAVCIDDVVWDASLGAFKFDQPNSWTTRWADQGRIFLSWSRQLRTTVRYHDFYVFPSAILDPEDALPKLKVE